MCARRHQVANYESQALTWFKQISWMAKNTTAYDPVLKVGLLSDRRERCPDGHARYNSTTRACDPCPAGTFANEELWGSLMDPDREICQPCPLGQISPSPKSARCTVCPSQTATVSEGSISCEAIVCQSEMFFSTDAEACVACPAGTYMPIAGATTDCIPCAVEDVMEFVVSECNGMARTVTYKWADGAICVPTVELPPDTTVECEYLPVDQPVVIAVFGLTGVAVLFFIVILALLLMLRKAPAIRRGQPKFLHLMLTGAIVVVLPIFLLPGKPSELNCFAPIVLTVLGFTMLFGCLLLKSYRVYRVFANPSLRDVKLNDKAMMRRLGVLLLIDIVILLVWALVALPVPVLQNKDVPGIGLVPIRACSFDETSGGFTFGIYIYKTILTLIMCYMGFKTRKVSADYSEAKYIFMSSHELLLGALIVLPLMNTIARDAPVVKYIVQSIGLLFVSIVCISLVLGTKVRLAIMKTTAVELATAEHERTARSASGSVMSKHTNGSKTSNDTSFEANEELNREVARLNDELATLKYELAELKLTNPKEDKQLDQQAKPSSTGHKCRVGVRVAPNQRSGPPSTQ